MKHPLLLLIGLFAWVALACSLGVEQAYEPPPRPTIPRAVVTVPPGVTAPAGPGLPSPLTVETPTPAPSPTAEAPDNLDATKSASDMPDTLLGLVDWVVAAYQVNTPLPQLCAKLTRAAWRAPEDSCAAYDLDGDSQAEWLLTIDSSRASGTPMAEGHPGDFWIVHRSGLFQQMGTEGDQVATAPMLVELADLTDDEKAEAVTAFDVCGAHTCVRHYQVFSYHNGELENLVVTAPVEEDGPPGSMIIMPTVNYEWLRDETGDEIPDLMLHGGVIGSSGAGTQRTRTEIWSWDGEAITLHDIQFDKTAFRHHRLYDANWALEQEKYEEARTLYEEVALREDLRDAPSLLEFSPDHDTGRAARQFAASRLTLTPLLWGDITDAMRWRIWLEEKYPEAPITEAAGLLMTEWEANRNDLAAACEAVTAFLEEQPAPTNGLAYMGYGNPELTADTVCPIRAKESED